MEKTTKIVFNESQPGETSLIGSPREKWKHQIHKDMWTMGLKEDNARDREKWGWVDGEGKYQIVQTTKCVSY